MSNLIKGFGFIVTSQFMDDLYHYEELNACKLESGDYFIGKIVKRYAPSSMIHLGRADTTNMDELVVEYMEWKNEILDMFAKEKEQWADEEVWKENLDTFNKGDPKLVMFITVP